VTFHKVGSIFGLFGLRGELKVEPTEAGEPLFQSGAAFLVRPQERRVFLASVRAHKGRLLVGLREALDVESALAFVGTELFAERERLDAVLVDDEILDVDLVGTAILDGAGRFIGEVRDVEHYPSSAMLVVGPKRTLIPFVKAYIVEFDRSARRLTLNLPEGLLD
jgi:16S rRNA processing protein RimM